jgi:hypothetical protein
LVTPIVFKITPRHGSRRSTPFPTILLLLRVNSLLREIVYRTFAQKRPWYIHPSRDRYIATVLQATLLSHTANYPYFYHRNVSVNLCTYYLEDNIHNDLSVFENRKLNRIFGSLRDKTTGGWTIRSFIIFTRQIF